MQADNPVTFLVSAEVTDKEIDEALLAKPLVLARMAVTHRSIAIEGSLAARVLARAKEVMQVAGEVDPEPADENPQPEDANVDNEDTLDSEDEADLDGMASGDLVTMKSAMPPGFQVVLVW